MVYITVEGVENEPTHAPMSVRGRAIQGGAGRQKRALTVPGVETERTPAVGVENETAHAPMSVRRRCKEAVWGTGRRERACARSWERAQASDAGRQWRWVSKTSTRRHRASKPSARRWKVTVACAWRCRAAAVRGVENELCAGRREGAAASSIENEPRARS